MAARGQLTPLKIGVREVYIKGTSPLLVHRFGSKAMHQMLAKMMGVPDKKDTREPEMDYVRSVYLMANDRFGFPCSAFKHAIVRSAKSTAAMAMTDARSAFYVQGEMTPSALGPVDLVEIVGAPVMHTDVATNDNGSRDFRFRALFNQWAVHLRIECNLSTITEEQLGQMILAAGYGVGIGERRREKGENMGAWTLGTKQEYEALAHAVTPERQAWFSTHRPLIERVAGENRRLVELILTNPQARDAAEQIVKKGRKATVANGHDVEVLHA